MLLADDWRTHVCLLVGLQGNRRGFIGMFGQRSLHVVIGSADVPENQRFTNQGGSGAFLFWLFLHVDTFARKSDRLEAIRSVTEKNFRNLGWRCG